MSTRSVSKRAWIIDARNRFVVEQNGCVFQYQLYPTERNGYSTVLTARQVMRRAEKALGSHSLVILTGE